VKICEQFKRFIEQTSLYVQGEEKETVVQRPRPKSASSIHVESFFSNIHCFLETHGNDQKPLNETLIYMYILNRELACVLYFE
jgi:hypothetical protein